MAKIQGPSLKNMPWQDPTDDAPVWRWSANPVIGRNPVKGVSRIFNSAVVPLDGKFVGVFRGETTTGIPYLYYGESPDGVNFTFNEEKIEFYSGDEKYAFQYAYDPRVVKVDEDYFIIWCDGKDGYPSIGLGKTRDFKKFELVSHPFLPFNRNGVLFPEKIDGKYVLLSRPSDSGHTKFGDIFLSKSKDLVYWGEHKLLMRCGYEWWQSLKIGAGSAPIKTDEGWLLFYHGANMTCSGYVYSMGAALLDLSDPSKVLLRTADFVLTPEKDYEVSGFVPNVVFPCAALADADTGRIAVYYGAADTVVGLCFTTADRMIDHLKKHGR
ncbi:MAG: glycoside hydrolase family 130 protein [Clostridia bacterium]|nr:glycoside hydrolase family 130 protein [Clostridia bacterium]